MKGMFSGCSGLTSLDVSKFNTENVTTMNGMFASCTALTNLNLSGFGLCQHPQWSREHHLPQGLREHKRTV